MAGNDDLRNAQGLRQLAGVLSACPAESDQRKISRIVAAFDGNHAQRPLHVGIYHPDDTLGELLQRQSRALAFSHSRVRARVRSSPE